MFRVKRGELPEKPMNEMNCTFLNAEQAAQFLGGLNARTVTRWSREGYLPSYPIGEGKRRLWRYLKEDLTTWMLGRRQGGSNAE
jgi:predicted site-specific integrase-resolvase